MKNIRIHRKRKWDGIMNYAPFIIHQTLMSHHHLMTYMLKKTNILQVYRNIKRLILIRFESS